MPIQLTVAATSRLVSSTCTVTPVATTRWMISVTVPSSSWLIIDRSSAPGFDALGWSGEPRLHPPRDVEQRLVGEARADQLDAERQAVARPARGQGQARRAGPGPDRVALRVAGPA